MVEELWFKPLIWLLPLFLLWFPERTKLNFFKGGILGTLLYGLGLGACYFLILFVIGFIREGTGLSLDWQTTAFLNFMGISLATAITEELAFSGYIFGKLSAVLKKPENAITLTAFLFALIHIPIGLFTYKFDFYQLTGFLVLVVTVQLANVWVMSRSRNVLAPILSHWLWSMAAFLLL